MFTLWHAHTEKWLNSFSRTASMGAQFSTVEIDNAIWFSIVSGPLEATSILND